MPRRQAGWYHGRMEQPRITPVTYHELLPGFSMTPDQVFRLAFQSEQR
jgi:hypothetical protein